MTAQGTGFAAAGPAARAGRGLAVAAVGIAAAEGSALAVHLQPALLLAAAAGAIVVVGTIVDPRIGLAALAFAMILSPELGSAVYIRADDVILAAVVLGWLARQAVHREPLHENPLLVPMVLLAAAGLAALGLALAAGNIDPFTGQQVPLAASALHWLKRVEYLLILFLVAQSLRSRAEVGLFAGLLLAASAIVAALGAVKIALHAGTPGFRLNAPFDAGEANTLGEYLMFALALSLGLFLSVRPAPLRLALLAVIALDAYAFLYTFSRGAYIGLIVAILVAALAKDARLLLAVGAIALVLPAHLPADVDARVETIPREIATVRSSDIGSNALLARVDSYRVAAKRVSERPVLGYGPGVVALERIESQYAKEAIDGGLLGLALFLWFLARAVRLGRQVLAGGRERLDQGLGLGYLAGVAAMAVAALGAIPFTTIRTMEAFSFASGLAVVLWRLQRTAPAQEARAR